MFRKQIDDFTQLQDLTDIIIPQINVLLALKTRKFPLEELSLTTDHEIWKIILVYYYDKIDKTFIDKHAHNIPSLFWRHLVIKYEINDDIFDRVSNESKRTIINSITRRVTVDRKKLINEYFRLGCNSTGLFALPLSCDNINRILSKYPSDAILRQLNHSQKLSSKQRQIIFNKVTKAYRFIDNYKTIPQRVLSKKERKDRDKEIRCMQKKKK
jgi:hypothetical protein